MTILIVVHNPELASEIATTLNRDGARTIVCPSVTSAEFLREFARSTLVVTDLAPPVLSLLTVDGHSLLAGHVPILVLTTVGHRATFTRLLPPGRAGCVTLEPGIEFLGELRAAAIRVLQQSSRPDRSGILIGQPPRAVREYPSPSRAAIGSKRIAVDSCHRLPLVGRARKALDRQVRFVSDIAHDIRTPLTAICEFARLMEAGLAGEMTDQQRRYVSIIDRRCQEAGRMVDDLLDAAKFQSGRIHPHRQAVSISEVLADVHETMEPAIRHSGVSFSSQIPDGLPRVFVDRDMLGRIVTNLVSNALKFSPAGGAVTIRAERHSVSMIRLSVTDSGIGISPEDMRRIFRRFEQGSNPVRSGVGLGLAIVRQLVKLHGGGVTAESTPGRGSRFQITLPLFLPIAIVRKHIASLGRRSPRAATIWAFACQEPAKYDAIHRLITATVSASDLVLPEDDRHRLLLVTQAKNPGRLVERLTRQIAAHSVSVPAICQLTPEDLKRWLEGVPALVPPRDGQAGSPSLAG